MLGEVWCDWMKGSGSGQGYVMAQDEIAKRD